MIAFLAMLIFSLGNRVFGKLYTVDNIYICDIVIIYSLWRLRLVSDAQLPTLHESPIDHYVRPIGMSKVQKPILRY